MGRSVPTWHNGAVDNRLHQRFARIRPLDQMEVAIVRALVERSGWLDRRRGDSLRYALNLARLSAVPTERGEVPLDDALEDFRRRIVDALEPLVLETAGVIERHELVGVLPVLHNLTERTRAHLLTRFADQFSAEDLDREVCHKALVVVAGGGGGSGYVFGGAFKLLDDLGFVPRLLVGTSMGSIMSAFRARRRDFDFDSVMGLAPDLKWREVLRIPRVRNRFGMPATLRLYLRTAIGRLFGHPDEQRMLWMREMEIPLRVVVAGVRIGGLSHDMDYYEHLMDDVVMNDRARRRALRRSLRQMIETIGELVRSPAALKEVVIGGDEMTGRFDVVDAVGFSSAVPGIIHYDIVREDPHMEKLMERLLKRHRIQRLVDGGVVNNVPSRTAWRAVQRGEIGTRNAFILAMDCFAPQLGRNLMLHPVQRMIRPQVVENARYASFTKSFLHVLSPLELVPDERRISTAVRNGYRELGHERHFIREMMRPLPPLPERL